MLLNNIKSLIHITEMNAHGAWHALTAATAAGAAGAGVNAYKDHAHEIASNVKDLSNTIDKKDIQMDTAAKVAGGAAVLGLAGKIASRKRSEVQ